MKRFFFGIVTLLSFQQIFSADDPLKTAPPSLLFELLALNGDLETAQKPKYLSPSSMVVSPDKKLIYIGEQTAKQVDVFSVATNTVTKTIKLPNEPTGIAVSSDGSLLYVTCASERWPNGMVCVVNTASGIIEKKISAGHMARSPVLSKNGSKLYVCNWLENTISFIDLSSGLETKRVSAIREPYSMVLSSNDSSLLVANMIPDGISTDTTLACKVCFINTSTGKMDTTFKLPDGSHSTMGVCLSPDGKYAFIPHLIGRVNLVAKKLDGGWVHSNNLAIVDMNNHTLYNDVELDDASLGAGNPWSATCSDDGKWLCVTQAGSYSVTVIDMPAMFKKLQGKGDQSHEFTFLKDIKNTIDSTKVVSPRSIVTIGSKAYVTGYFSQSISSFDLTLSTKTATSYALAPDIALTAERKGEKNFYSADLCQDKWQSCQSCHPFTRPDGLNWILTDSYLSAPKNAKSMLYTFQTPCANWGCKRNNAFESVRAGIALELQIEASADIAFAIDTFFLRLKPVPSPYLVKGKLSESAQKGKALYYNEGKVDCIKCHPAPLFTNLLPANAGVVDKTDANLNWDTPSLIEAWRTSPYDHIGSHDKIEDIIKLPGHSRNVNEKLSPEEFKDLVQYILSL